ncbi:MAG: glycosyltransferase family 87 protein [Nannocystaceae bacterium]
MDVTRADTEEVKIWLALAGMLLVFLWRFIATRAALGLLIALTLVAMLNYARWGPRQVAVEINNYDLMHYYLATRYFDELGYYDLYPAALLVDQERGRYDGTIRRCRLQDQDGYQLVPVSRCVARGRVVRAEHFSAERWAAFEHDFLYLQRSAKMSRRQWREMIQDRGYNATPAWVVLMKPLTSLVSVEAIKWLCWLDFVYLAIGLVALRWAYGVSTMLWCAFFLAVTYSLRWPMPTQVFSRYDWVAALMVAMACLRKGQPFVAGVLTGFSALVRLFPAVWLFGPIAKGAAGLLRGGAWRKRIDRRLLTYAGGVLACVLVVESAALLRFGSDAAVVHVENITEHIRPEQLSSRRLGFALGYAYEGERLPKYISVEKKQNIKEDAGERLPLVGLTLLALAWGLHKMRDDEVFAFGCIPFFLLATASYYYYVARITLIATHASDLSRLRNRVGLALLLALEVFSNWAETAYPGHRVFLIGRLAWGLTAYVMVMVLWLGWERWRANRVEQQHDPRQ